MIRNSKMDKWSPYLLSLGLGRGATSGLSPWGAEVNLQFLSQCVSSFLGTPGSHQEKPPGPACGLVGWGTEQWQLRLLG